MIGVDLCIAVGIPLIIMVLRRRIHWLIVIYLTALRRRCSGPSIRYL